MQKKHLVILNMYFAKIAAWSGYLPTISIFRKKIQFLNQSCVPASFFSMGADPTFQND